MLKQTLGKQHTMPGKGNAEVISNTGEKPVGSAVRIVLYTLFIWFASVLAWAVAGEADRVMGVQKEARDEWCIMNVQAEREGVVKGFYVTEGQRVSKGQVLLELDSGSAAREYGSVKRQVAYCTLEVSRLQAELADTPWVPDRSLSGLVAEDLEYQLFLYHTRSGEYQRQQETIHNGLREAENGLKASLIRKGEYLKQLELAGAREGRLGQSARPDALETVSLRQERAQRILLYKALADEESAAERCNLAVIRQRRALAELREAHNAKIALQLQETQGKLQGLTGALQTAQEAYSAFLVTAPVDGAVRQLMVHAAGETIVNQQLLMTITAGHAK